MNETVRPSFAIEWREGFKIGVNQVDTEHRQLFTLVKALSIDNIRETVDALLEYVVTHFTNEQALMEHSGYPDFRAHLAMHESFAAQVAEFLASDEDWSEERLHNLRKFLNKWLVGHILTHDLRFGKWYLEHGKDAAVQMAAPAAKGQASWLDRLLGRG